MSNTNAAQWRDWRHEREQALTDPHGWLSLTALHWLDTEPRRLPGLPGVWQVAGTTVLLDAAREDALLLDGEPVEGSTALTPRDGAPGELVTAGQRRIEVIRRGASYAVRLRDPDAPSRTRFTGVPTYAFDPAWVVDGVFEAFDTPEEVVVGAVVDGLTHRYTGIGRVRFSLAGQEHALTAYAGHAGADGLTIQFRDATSGLTIAVEAGERDPSRPGL